MIIYIFYIIFFFTVSSHQSINLIPCINGTVEWITKLKDKKKIIAKIVKQFYVNLSIHAFE
jgi:hypothetical protein